MSLTPGTKFGPYEIVSPLGAGGMGEVYRAKDARLGREVAIKVLPAGFAADGERLKRFELEAKATSALNHPNILTVYDIGTHEGAPYLVAELLEGQTLRDKLTGPLPPKRAVEWAIQMAHGLAAAHEKGIVHRDLKPENLFITKDNRLKILDFGLAKLIEPVQSQEENNNTPTRTVNTSAGVVMGTAGYMSPEQVRGEPIDLRSDLFAFGVILYEMISGQRAFRKNSVVETMNAILTEEPPEFPPLNPAIPPGLDRLIRHCLEKQPAARYQSARDLAFQLEALSGMSGVSGSGFASIPASRPPALRRAWMALAAAGVLAAAFAAVFVLGKQRGESPPASYKLLTYRRGIVSNARFAPDGETVVYSAAWDGNPFALYSVQIGRPESRALELPPGQLFAVSSTGELALRGNGAGLAPGTLSQSPLAGGAPRELLENVSGADWSPDGKTMAIVRRVDGKSRLEYPIGHLLRETTGLITHPRVSRDGEHVAFIEHLNPTDDGGQLMRSDQAGKVTPMSPPMSSLYGLSWSADGSELWYTGAATGSHRALWAVRTPNRPRLVARVPGNLALCDIAPGGRVLLGLANRRLGINALPPGETQERDLSWFDSSHLLDISPDGATLLFDEAGEGGGDGISIYLRKTDRSPAVRLGEGEAGALSPDGKWVIAKNKDAPTRRQLIPTGPGERQILTNPAGLEYHQTAWFPDSRRLVFIGNEPGRPLRLYRQDVFDGAAPTPISKEGSVASDQRPAVSPSGASVAAIGVGGKINLFPVAGGAPQPLGGVEPRVRLIGWSRDGRALFYYTSALGTIRVYRHEVAAQQPQLWKAIVPADPAGLVATPSFRLAGDEKSYAYNYYRVQVDLYLAEGLK